ncbi:uncharacterized protein B0I36DRAFT_106228 [Microdochium trichocladiopsis]|uniref:Secreted protein n=1 Tax=Microdochium trichocladiopsis TaxID=1682393 RepID=A0A9P8Y8P3_9PEZI|nr:uncharacterized protein B0I36DRAFT_106228 [Microdochium trichocladiopsis]KAH7033214.1 hypothetical protein B0I36DRAFT_106228 [Microdochium trichocladiopsis]
MGAAGIVKVRAILFVFLLIRHWLNRVRETPTCSLLADCWASLECMLNPAAHRRAICGEACCEEDGWPRISLMFTARFSRLLFARLRMHCPPRRKRRHDCLAHSGRGDCWKRRGPLLVRVRGDPIFRHISCFSGFWCKSPLHSVPVLSCGGRRI